MLTLNKRIQIYNKFKILFFLTFLVFILSWPSLFSFFLSDDFVLLKNTPTFSINNLISIFSKTWKGYFTGVYHWHNNGLNDDLYRPIINLSFLIDKMIWGLNPFGYHLTNIGMYIFCCFIVYELSVILLKSEKLGYLTTLLFALHPSHIQTVLSISNRTDLVAGLFLLLSFYIYLIFKRSEKQKFLFLSNIFYFLSLFAKETVILYPLIIIFYELIVIDKNNKRYLATLGFILVNIVYLLIRFTLFKGIGSYGNLSEGFLNILSLRGILSLILKIIGLAVVGKMRILSYLFFNYLTVYSYILFLFCVPIIVILGHRLVKIIKTHISDTERRLLLFSFVSFVFLLIPVLPIIGDRFMFVPALFIIIGILIIIKYLLSERLVIPLIITVGIFYGGIWLQDNTIIVANGEIARSFILKLEAIQNNCNEVFAVVPNIMRGEYHILLNGAPEAASLFSKVNSLHVLALLSSPTDVINANAWRNGNTVSLKVKFPTMIEFSQVDLSKITEGTILENDYSKINIEKKEKGKIKEVTISLFDPVIEDKCFIMYNSNLGFYQF